MFHHDALRRPNGDTAVLGGTQVRINGHNVTSDMIVVLDANFQVVWTWDVLDHFTPPATFPAGIPTGSPICCLPDPGSIDWTHANGLGWSPQDADLTLSFRQTNLVIKIAYQNGHGPGTVLWRLGQGGDFTVAYPRRSGTVTLSLNTTGNSLTQVVNPSPWFSGQHNATLINATTLVVFDNGYTRCQVGKVKGCHSASAHT